MRVRARLLTMLKSGVIRAYLLAKKKIEVSLTTSGVGNTDISPDANISNALLDKVYYQNVRKGAGRDAYGRENGRPVFALSALLRHHMPFKPKLVSVMTYVITQPV